MQSPVKEELLHLKVADVAVVEGRNKRFDEGDLNELADSIEHNGVSNPIKVQKISGKYQLVDGHRRRAACEILRKRYVGKKVPVVNKFPITSLPARLINSDATETDIVISMLVSNDGKPFLPLEEAQMFKDLHEAGMKNDEIAKKIGKSVAHVSDRLSLLNASGAVQSAVEDGSLNTRDAVAISRRIKDEGEQAAMVKRVQEEGSSVINKELLKGRLKKEQWETAEILYDDFIASKMHPEITSHLKKPGNDIDQVLMRIIERPDFEYVYNLGRMAGAGAMAHLNVTEILNKLHTRMNGTGDVYKEKKGA